MNNLQFYDLLLKDATFKNKLGEAMLLSGKLETILAKLLKKKNLRVSKRNQILNSMIKKLLDKNLINENTKAVLDTLTSQRNCLAHSIFGELVDFYHDESEMRVALPTEELVPADVQTYVEYITIFNQNILAMLDIFEEMLLVDNYSRISNE